jgi:hypothetical protein
MQMGKCWKPNLKNALEVELSSCTAEGDIDVSYFDGYAVLWRIPWPPNGTV